MLRVILLTTALTPLSACAPMPVIGGPQNPEPVAINAFPIPSCLFLCTSHISVIREDVASVGQAPITTGAKSSTSNSSNTGNGP